MALSSKTGFTKQQRYLLLVALFAVIAGLVFYGIFKSNLSSPKKDKLTREQAAQDILAESATSTISFLNGLEVPLASASSCVAIMIDNAPEVERQFGLNKASLVYEAPVEGGRTRFMAVYGLATSTVATIGPVRSARPYFLDWVQELGCLYAHVGGSNEALEKIKNLEINDLNEFYNGGYFWRNKKYTAPHNTFTDIETLAQAWEKTGNKDEQRVIKSWLFAKKEAKILPAGINYFEEQIGDLKVSWSFDQNLKKWKRFVNNKAAKDNVGTITAKNVVFQYVWGEVLDEVGRLSLQTIGSGRAVILKEGNVIEGRWEKKSAGSRTRFFGPDTKEMEFNPGLIWVEVATKISEGY
ncbi:MAG: hypothetical protein UT86_C0006G0019 [Candidatus Magasanikbacteria bacterium GW2011_GWC2_40_17]|uniref:DUF3048 domain-containing protein n=1 Tax=Candidatus Magasanikbacteria bacterium GW2011_GWA2_42_32 TaxID=1619039 RepID=A0A0G1D3T4_9BACT|nr:MAG: hypothetical protein UT86_C0006G0019 [Candidatus Magasanikbacteria bacterium GW2011_GWC2_40_17]KKS56643.1 MAG: hypothetical protein UV20_C0008G0019 [Candidatus Magasanikbacteria bacterium GW2011_GWA2_42_32]OGH86092.1 MAG: hypothetical protein A2294_04080 [Candidatus Magasanikbacteria bacterium RIFOXYB2_FULL_38_10]